MSVFGQPNWRLDFERRQHVFKNMIEMDDARGGYLPGKIWFDDKLLLQKLKLIITLVAGNVEDAQNIQPNRIHPCLLHITRIEGNRRRKELEPKRPCCSIELQIDGDKVSCWIESNERDAGELQAVARLKVEEGEKYLDLKDIRINVLAPYLRTAGRNDFTIQKGLEMREEVLERVFPDKDKEEVEKIISHSAKFYSSFKNRQYLDRICLEFSLIAEENFGVTPHPSQYISETITNSKNKTIGDFAVHKLIPNYACCHGESECLLLFEFKLARKHKDDPEPASPKLLVYDERENVYKEDCRLVQPRSFSVGIPGNFCLSFTAPRQDPEVIAQIYKEGKRIVVEAVRTSDKAMSNKFCLRYYNCVEDAKCPSCDRSTNEIPEEPALTRHACPGRKRRATNQPSPSHVFRGASLSPQDDTSDYPPSVDSKRSCSTWSRGGVVSPGDSTTATVTSGGRERGRSLSGDSISLGSVEDQSAASLSTRDTTSPSWDMVDGGGQNSIYPNLEDCFGTKVQTAGDTADSSQSDLDAIQLQSPFNSRLSSECGSVRAEEDLTNEKFDGLHMVDSPLYVGGDGGLIVTLESAVVTRSPTSAALSSIRPDILNNVVEGGGAAIRQRQQPPANLVKHGRFGSSFLSQVLRAQEADIGQMPPATSIWRLLRTSLPAYLLPSLILCLFMFLLYADFLSSLAECVKLGAHFAATLLIAFLGIKVYLTLNLNTTLKRISVRLVVGVCAIVAHQWTRDMIY